MTAIAVEATQDVRRERAVPHVRIPLSRVMRVELRKMFDTRSGFWLMASIAITSTLATTAIILFAPDENLTYASFGTAIGFPMAVILPVIAILSVTSEWSQRSGLTTFTLIPHRSRVIFAKAVCAVAVGVVSMVVALAIGAVGNLVGTAIAGTDPVWDIALIDAVHIVVGNVLGLMIGFMLGVLIRNSPGAIVAYFVYSLVLPGIAELLAENQEWFRDVRGWVDVNYAQSFLFSFDGSLTGEQWAHIGVTGLVWLVLPLAIGLGLLARSEIK